MSVYQSAPTLEQAAITAKDFNFWYGDFHALTGLDLNIAKNAITSFIGPSGCGKSTFLRCINSTATISMPRVSTRSISVVAWA